MVKSENHILAYTLKCLLIAGACGVLLSMVLLLVFSLMINADKIPQDSVYPLAMSSVLIGGAFSGIIGARKMKNRKLLFGFLSGIVFFVLFLLIGLLESGGMFSFKTAVLTLLIAIVGSTIGGFLSPVKKRRK